MRLVHLSVAMTLSATAAAQSKHGSKEEQDEQLRKDCKGVGIGKYCGMKHQH